MIQLKVALIGRSNHRRMNLIVMESKFSITYVLARLATVRCEESFENCKAMNICPHINKGGLEFFFMNFFHHFKVEISTQILE